MGQLPPGPRFLRLGAPLCMALFGWRTFLSHLACFRSLSHYLLGRFRAISGYEEGEWTAHGLIQVLSYRLFIVIAMTQLFQYAGFPIRAPLSLRLGNI